jgi:O-antigen biosynthesis protein
MNTKNETKIDSYIQVYWEQENDFADSNSVKMPLVSGQSIYDITLPGHVCGRLRLDPINYPAYIEIYSIILFDAGSESELQEINSWSAENDFVGLSLAQDSLRLDSNENLRIAFVDEDPQLILLNSSCPGNHHPKVLRVTLEVSPDLHKVLSQELGNIDEDLAGLKEKHHKLSEELERTKLKLVDSRQQLERIIDSSSWRVVNLLRRIPWNMKRLLIPLGISVPQALIPATRLRAVEGEQGKWEALAKDPQFLLYGPWPKGWTEVSWSAASGYPLRMRIYFDRGRGFNDMENLDLSVVFGEERTRYSVIIPMGKEIRGVRLDPGEAAGTFTLSDLKMKSLTRLHIFMRATRRFFKKRGVSYDSISYFVRLIGSALVRSGVGGVWNWAKDILMPSQDYEQWVIYNAPTEKDIERIKAHIPELTYKPLFSIVVPVYNVEEIWLRKCIESVQAQLYPYWELCIADDASPNPRIRQVLEEYAAKDSRIKVVYREQNGHISAASNSALEIASGEFIVLLDNDDELTRDALYENVLLLNNHPEADMIYSDEDKISEVGERHTPFFKPDWSPDNFLSMMYTCHLGVYRTDLVRGIGGFRLGFEGSQDHDLVLRLTEQTSNIYHIPKILYHWRTVAQSTAMNPSSKSYAVIAGEKAIQEALDRRGEGGRVEAMENLPGRYMVHYPTKNNPLISILIPTRNMASVLEPCLISIFEKSTYTNYEVIVIDNGSKEQETLTLFEQWKQREPERFKVITLDIPFNYSRLNNEAAKQTKGELLLLLNNDIEVITPNWLEEMAGQAMRASIGAVGAKLYFPDNTIQHAGVTLGVGGVAGHTFRELDANHPGYFDRLIIVSNYSAVTGACLMVRRELFEEVGGLEEELQVAFNDVDFCLKLLEKGYRNLLVPQVKLYHHESKSRGYEDTPDKMQRFLGEVNRMKKRWDGLLYRDPCYNPNLTLKRSDYSVEIPDYIS